MLRPDAQIGLIALGIGALCGAGLVAAMVAGPAPTVFAWITGPIFAVAIVLGAASMLRSRLVLTPDEIVVHGLVSRRHRPRSQAVEAVRATIIAPGGSGGDNLFVLDAHGGVLVRAPASTYGREALDRLVGALSVPCGGPDHAVTADALAKEYPGLVLVSRVERHSYRIAFAIIGALGAVVLTLVLVTLVSAS